MAIEAVASELRSRATSLRDASARARDDASLGGALAKLDTGLDEFAARVLGLLDETPLAELRARFAFREVAQRDDLLALLDLVIAEEAGLEGRYERIDLLVLMLSTQEHGGRRRVVRDPATLTPALEALSARVASTAELDLARVESEFLEAARRCENGAVSDVVVTMGARRTALGRTALAPQALRAIVFFHAATLAPSTARKVAPLAAGSAARENPTPARAPVGSTSLAAAIRATPDAATLAVVPAGVQWNIGAQPVAATVVSEPETPQRRAIARMVASAIAVTAAAVVVGFLVWETDSDAAHVLSTQELRAISGVLASGYRDGAQSGPLFVGTVTPDWKGLSAAARERNANQIFTTLETSGVRELMLYDTRNRLVVHQSAAYPARITN